MSASTYRYYVCDDPNVSSDILRAAIHSEVENFSLRVFARAGDGRIVDHSCSRSVGSTAAAAVESRLTDRPASLVGLAAALGGALACGLFLPLLYSLGRWPFVGLIFLASLIAAWAGGAFSLPISSRLIRRRLKKLQPEQLFIVCYATDTAQQGIHQILSRYSVVATSGSRSSVVAEDSADRA